MTKESRNKAKAVIGSIIFHIFLLLALIFLGLSTPLPLPGEEGVEVNLGSSDVGMGEIQAESPAPVQNPPPPPQEQVVQEEEIQEDIITQDIEAAPSIEEEKKEEPEEKEVVKEEIKEDPPEEVREEISEETKPDPEPEPEPEPEPQVNARALYKGKSNSGTGQDEGTTGQPGDQGKEHGDPDASNYDGQGGSGNGVSFSLGGRGAKHLPKPSYNSQEQGKVVVDIWVNKEGKVVKAMAGAKGTTIVDLRLRKVAEEAALRSVFQPDPNAPYTQKGTITYNFIRLN